MNNFQQLLLLGQTAESIFDMEAKLRRQREALTTAIMRELGGEITFDEPRQFSVLLGNQWHDVSSIKLIEDENFEIYIKTFDDKTFDLEDIEMFDTNIFGCDLNYMGNEFLEFLKAVISYKMNSQIVKEFKIESKG